MLLKRHQSLWDFPSGPVVETRLYIPNSGGRSSIPGQGTRPHMLKPRPSAAKYINKTFLKETLVQELGDQQCVCV